MPSLPSRYSGDTYVDIINAMMLQIGEANGLQGLPAAPAPLRVINANWGGFVPRLSNGEAVALLQAWRPVAARGRVPWPLWVDLEAYALGQREPGQRFDMSREHRTALLPPEALGLVWTAIAQLAIDLDDASAVARPVTVAWTDAAYDRGARDTWEAIKDTVRRAPRPVSPPPPKPPDVPPEFGDIIEVIADPLKPLRPSGTSILLVLGGLFVGYLILTSD